MSLRLERNLIVLLLPANYVTCEKVDHTADCREHNSIKEDKDTDSSLEGCTHLFCRLCYCSASDQEANWFYFLLMWHVADQVHIRRNLACVGFLHH